MNEHLSPRESVIEPGETAPDFTLMDRSKSEWTLSEAVRKGDVVLCFFPMAFTGVCGTENECITKEMARWSKGGATMIGISCDSFPVLKAWGEQMGFEHTLLADMHRKVCRAYGLYWADLNVSKRGTVVIGQADDGKGVVKWSQAREPGSGMDVDEVLAQLA